VVWVWGRAGVAAPQLFLVSFFSYEPDVSFQPEDLQLSYQGRLLRPLAIVPVTRPPSFRTAVTRATSGPALP